MKLTEDFNQQDFDTWIEGFLPDFDRNVRKVDVPVSFSNVKSINTLGESPIGVRVYVIETDADPSRRKVGLATDSFTLLKNYGSPNAIIAYYSASASLWRISLLTSTPIWSEGKIITKLSNPKRQSYVLGSKAKVKTPHQYLIGKGKVLDFNDLKSRFSLEVVNKEFYKEISQAFTRLVGGTVANGKSKKSYEALLKLPFLKDHSQTNLEFAVRLIGRIIFCWFLREKRSASGHSLMPKELVSFEASDTIEDYYHKILEPIFFEILNKPIKTRKESYINELFSAIPYLNGGLFSPHEDDFFNYNEGKQAVNHNMVIVPDKWLKSLFEVLETYNFTIDENTSFDEELSIDPEMLGRIFENLLAEINPETGESARKSTGSYYTPRVIVDYMIDESLQLYLKEKTGIVEDKLRSLISYDLDDDTVNPLSDDEKSKIAQALGEIKILDPACGSGAFPIGALQKIVFILQQIDQHGQLWFKKQIQNTPIELRKVIEREFHEKNFDYIRKLGIIRENIYGIDIQPIATEISRLRCFLTLVVDERIDDTLDNRGIEPLPNLDFKFVTANTLVGLPATGETVNQMGLFEDDQGIKDLKEVRDMFFNASGFERDQLKLQFVQVQNKMFQKLISEGRRGHADLTTKLTTWDPFSHKSAGWFDPEWMFGIKGGFDLIVANPPYIQFQKLDIYTRNFLRTHNYYESQSDLWYFFVYKSHDLLRDSGLLSFIVSNYFLQAGHAQTLRKFITARLNPVEIVNFTDNYVFENVGIHSLITIFRKSSLAGSPFTLNYRECNNINSISVKKGKSLKLSEKDLGSVWKLFTDSEKRIIDKISEKGRFLSTFCTISNGIKSGEDKVFIIDDQSLETNIEQDLLKKYIKNSDIHRYYVDLSTKKIIYIPSTIDINQYPKFNSYISTYKHVLENKWKNRGELNDYWKIYRPREEIYSTAKPLIVTPYRANEIMFSLNFNSMSGTDTYIIKNNSNEIDEYVLLGILNSKLVRWFYKRISKKKGKIYEISTKELSRIPVAFPSEQPSKLISDYVKRIIKIYSQKDYSKSDIDQLENSIDTEVFKLYKLDKEDVKHIDEESND